MYYLAFWEKRRSRAVVRRNNKVLSNALNSLRKLVKREFSLEFISGFFLMKLDLRG